jgi:hypothetical protein
MAHGVGGRGEGWWRLGSALALALAGGCATTTYWTPAHVAAAQGAVNSARASGAEEDPQAARQLHLAEGQLAAARERIAAGENRDAGWLLTRAQADAELSLMLQREAHARLQARDVERQLAQLRAGGVAPVAPAVPPPPPPASAH